MKKFIPGVIVLIIIALAFLVFAKKEPYYVLVYPPNKTIPDTLGVFDDLSNATFSAKQYVQSNPEADYAIKRNCEKIPEEGEVCEEVIRRFEFSGEGNTGDLP